MTLSLDGKNNPGGRNQNLKIASETFRLETV